MTFGELLEGVAARAAEHERRALSAIEGLSSEQFNKPAGKEWSVAHVFKHLCLADEPYLNAMQEALASAKDGTGEVQHSMVGKFLIKVSGPEGNAPAPGFLVPPALALSRGVVDEWRKHHTRFIELVESAKGKDLSTKTSNPFIKFLRMSIADMLAVMDAHTERHVRQIEERSRLARNS